MIGCVYGNHLLLVLEFCAWGSLKAALTAVRTFKGDAAAADAPPGNDSNEHTSS